MRHMLLLLTLTLSSSAFAVDNFFIPYYYRNRPAMDTFSAIGWSDRHLVNAEITHDWGEVDDHNGFDTNDFKYTSESLLGAYRLPNNLSFEASLFRNEEQDNLPLQSGRNEDFDTNEYHVAAGYEFTGTPIALGVAYTNHREEVTSQNTGHITESTTHTASIGAGYRLEHQYFLGIGYINQDFLSGHTDQTARNYYLGGGKVWGDLKTPDAAMEAYLFLMNNQGTQEQLLRARGLINCGPLQYYGAAAYGVEQGDAAGSNWDLRLGVDYEINHWYVGPELFVSGSTTSSGTQADNNNLTGSLEGGYRFDKFDAYLRYGNQRITHDFDDVTVDTKNTQQWLTAGGSFKF